MMQTSIVISWSDPTLARAERTAVIAASIDAPVAVDADALDAATSEATVYRLLDDADRRTFARLVVGRAVAAISVAATDPSQVRVVGAGLLANTVRAIGASGGAEATAVIDTTGSGVSIVESIKALGIDGRLVLAAWPPHPEWIADYYADLHRSPVVVTGPAADHELAADDHPGVETVLRVLADATSAGAGGVVVVTPLPSAAR
ncbi:MAG: hypothetical protein R2715_19970 [Ilumatobacteraceae bacterium]